jgi:GH25 family lysozyme M1 (1,4-beta-N-acetylmuramidase)
MTRAVGIDLSKYDLVFNPKTATIKSDFVIQRVGYGGFWGTMNKDEKFDILLPGVMEVPIRGGYWYLSSHSNWMKQADFYLEQVAGLDYHFHNVDFEIAFNDLSIDFGAECVEFVRYVAKETKKPSLIYTARSYYDDFIAPDYRAKDIPLWISSPVGASVDPQTYPTPLPSKRVGWDIWQYTWSIADAKAWGVGRPKSIDLNVFNGTVEEMRAWLNLDVDMPPVLEPTDEEKLALLWGAHPELH